MITKEEVITKMVELIEAAYQHGHSDGKASVLPVGEAPAAPAPEMPAAPAVVPESVEPAPVPVDPAAPVAG